MNRGSHGLLEECGKGYYKEMHPMHNDTLLQILAFFGQDRAILAFGTLIFGFYDKSKDLRGWICGQKYLSFSCTFLSWLLQFSPFHPVLYPTNR